MISNNYLACIDDLTNDLESLESAQKPPKKKLKKSKPVQKSKRAFSDSEDEEIIQTSSSESKNLNFVNKN